VVYRGKLLTVKTEEVKLATGRVALREIVEHPGAVAIVAMTDSQEVLLVEQHRPGARGQLLEIPAGTIDPGETPEECARRELQEETGYQAQNLERLGGFYLCPGYSTEFLELFLGIDLLPAYSPPDADEDLTLHRLAFPTALAAIDAGQLRDAKTVAGLLLAARRLARR
jgi:ADP-ribose pyrophosphatase